MSKIVRNIPDGLEASYADIKLDTIADLVNLTGTPPDIVWVSGYHTKGDGSYGSHILEWDPDSTEPHNGGTIFELGAPFPTDWSNKTQLDAWYNYSGGTTGRYKLRYEDAVNVKWFGAVGNFDRFTGIGHDDLLPIQKAFDFATSLNGCEVHFPNGNYYSGNLPGNYDSIGVQINIGDTTKGSAKNIVISGDNATIFQGRNGRLLGLLGVDNILIKKIKFIGYTGNATTANYSNSALITVNYNSTDVKIDNCYFTNSLGDCIYVGGSLSDGSIVGLESSNISITNNTLKERYGDGIPSFYETNGVYGTHSRLAIALVDVINAFVSNNTIYGSVDLEPNADNQHIVNVSIDNNKFLSGNVQAQSSIGTNYWYDEPLNSTSGSIIDQKVTLTTVAANGIFSSNVVENNTFEKGLVGFGGHVKFDYVANNVFQEGLVIAGSTSGTNYNSLYAVYNNICYKFYENENCFIKLNGNVYLSNFNSNAVFESTGYCINNSGVNTGDAGRNVFVNNSIIQGISALGFNVNSTSVSISNTCMANPENPAYISSLKTPYIQNTLYTFNADANTTTINLDTIKSNIIFVYLEGGVSCSINDITTSVEDGFELTIIGGASSGGNITLTQGNFRTYDGNDAVLASNNIIKFIRRASLWFEITRNF